MGSQKASCYQTDPEKGLITVSSQPGMKCQNTTVVGGLCDL